jgi:hypothetical protein
MNLRLVAKLFMLATGQQSKQLEVACWTLRVIHAVTMKAGRKSKGSKLLKQCDFV